MLSNVQMRRDKLSDLAASSHIAMLQTCFDEFILTESSNLNPDTKKLGIVLRNFAFISLRSREKQAHTEST
jgi:hypothetical protein